MLSSFLGSPPQPEQAGRSQRLWLLLLRSVWLLVTAMVVQMYTVGLPVRITYLVTVFPFGGKWSSLTLAEAHLLDMWGIPLPAYFWTILLSDLILAGCCLALGVLIVWRQSHNPGAILCSILVVSMGCSESDYTSVLADVSTYWNWAHLILQTLAPYLGLVIFYVFPDGHFVPRWTRWLALGYGLLMLAWLFFPSIPFSPLPNSNFNATPIRSTLVFFGWQTTGLIAMAIRYRFYSTPMQRQQTKWAIFGLVLGLGTAICFYVGRWAIRDRLLAGSIGGRFVYELASNLIYMVVLMIIVGCFTRAILRHQLWDIDLVIRRTLRYALWSTLLLGAFALSVVLSQAVVRSQALNGFNVIDNELTTLITLLCVLIFEPLRRRLQTMLEQRFDRVTVDFRPTLIAFSRELQQLTQVPDLLRTLLQQSTALFKIAYGAVYLRIDDGRFQLSDSLYMPETPPPLFESRTADQLTPEADVHRPHDPTWPLLIPLTALQEGERIVIGVLALGPRRSEEPYQRAVIEVLLALADRAGIAISIAQLVAYQLSPAGRAEALAQSLGRAPSTVLTELHHLTQIALASPEQAAILAALPAAFQRRGLPDLVAMASGYRLVAESRDDLALLVAGLRTLADATVPPDTATPQLYRLCQMALEAEQVAALGLLLPAALRLTSGDETALRTPAPLTSVVLLFQHVLRTLDGLPRQETIVGQLTCLRQARAQLEQLASRIPSEVDLVERHIARRIVRHWLRLIDGQWRLIQGQARVAIRLITSSVVLAPEIRLVVEVRNRGQGPARQLVVELEPGVGYQTQEYQQHLTELAPGSTELMTFVLQRHADAPLRPTMRLRYDDLIDVGAIQTLTLSVAVLPAPSWSGPLPNPYVAGMPLRPGNRMFVGREHDIATIARALTRPLPTALVLTGQRRMGKTSLLQQLGSRLEREIVAVYLDGQLIGVDPGMPRLYADIATKIAGALQLPTPNVMDFVAEPVNFFIEHILPQAFAAAQGRRLLLMIDEIESLEARVAQGKLDPAFFGVLRHLMQHEPRLALICAGSHRLDELRLVAWTSIFNAALHYRLGDLPDSDARALITTPLGGAIYYDDLALDQILHLSGGHPYFLQLFCRELIDQANERQQTVLTLEHVLALLGQILILGEAPLADLWGDSSADEQWVLVALARLLPPTALFDAPQLMAAIAAYNLTADRDTVDMALQRLCWRDILATEEELLQTGERRYRWRLALFGHWITRTQALISRTPSRQIAVGSPLDGTDASRGTNW